LLNKHRIKYLFTGALAVNYYGRPRTSMDIDVIIDNDENKLMKIVKSLKARGLNVIESDVKQAIREGSHFSVFSEYSPYYFDFKVVKPIEKSMLNRTIIVKLWRRKAYLPKPEDLIVSKLIFGSEQDINDVKSILLRQKGKIDYKYLRNLSIEKNVIDKLEKLI